MSFEFKIPKVFKTIHLSEYAPEFKDAHIDVLVNLPKKLTAELYSIILTYNVARGELFPEEKGKNPTEERKAVLLKEISELEEKIHNWYCNVWYLDGNHLTKEEVDAIFKEAEETDASFMNWLVDKTFDLINGHREARKN